jgi:hypothetical protein
MKRRIVIAASALVLAVAVLASMGQTTIQRAFNGVINLGTLTADQLAINTSATWNNGGTTFSHWKATITDTASAAASKPIEIVAGAGGNTSIFSVRRDGYISSSGMGATGQVLASMFGITAGGSTAGVVTSTQKVSKAVTGIANGTPTAVFTVTVPNAAHTAMIRFTLEGALGAGGAVGEREASATISYDFTIARTAGVATAMGTSTAYGSATASVAGAATITIAGSTSALSGANNQTQTFTLRVQISRGSGAATNHTCVATVEVINHVASGVTVS